MKGDTDIAAWINPRYHDPRALARSYKAAKPFAHTSLRGFLREEKAERLAQALAQQRFTRKESDLFRLAQTDSLERTRDPVLAAFVAFARSPAFREYMQAITSVTLRGGIDIHGSLYTDTDYLLCHDDQLTGRKIAYILYLGPRFLPSDGGALALLAARGRGPGKVVKRISPDWNTLNFFTVSAKSWHAVEEVLSDKPRLAIGGWLH